MRTGIAMKNTLLSGVLWLFIAALVTAPVVSAQTMLTDFTGVVTDPSGAAIPDAAVTVTNERTNAQRTANTNSEGMYRIDGVTAGAYTLEVKVSGFKRFVQANIAVTPGLVKRLDVALQLGEVTESVEVTATVPVLQTDSATLSTGLPTPVREKPVASMTRGALIGEQLIWAAGSAAGGVYTFNGNRADNNQYNMEGLQFYFISSSVVNSAIDTVDAVVSNAPAEYARAVTVNATLKGGSNKFHGEFWAAFVNPRLNALRDPFSSPTLQRGPGVTSWREFATFSGPIKKDKIFFFYSWGRPNNFSSEVVGQNQSFPSLAMQSGDFSKFPATIIDPTTGNPFPGNIIPAGRISSVSKNIMNQFMGSTVTYRGDPNGFRNNVQDLSGRYRRDQDHYAKVDYNVGTKDIVSGWFQTHKVISNFDRWHGQIGSADALHTSSQDDVWNMGIGFTHTHTFSPKIVNQLRFGGTRFVLTHNQLDGWQASANKVLGKDFVSAWGLQGVSTPDFTGMPQVGISGWLRTYNDNQTGSADTRYSVYDNISVMRSRHTVKLGYAGVKLLEDGPASGLYFGGFNFSNTFTGTQVANAGVCTTGQVCGDAFADFLLGLPISQTRYQPRPVIARRKWEHGVFIQDDFHVNSKLTLNYGLRWDRYTVPYDKNGLYYNFDPKTLSIVVPDDHARQNINPAWPTQVFPVKLASEVGFPAKLINGNNSWQPRFGFAYRLTNKTVLRGGYGLYNGASRFVPLQAFGPYVISETFTNEVRRGSATGALYAWPNAFPTSTNTATISTATGFSTDYKESRTHNYNFTIEHEVLPNWGLLATYRGTANRGLLWSRDLNAIPASGTPFSQSRRPYPQLSTLPFVENGGTSGYQGLEFRLTHPWIKGLYSSISFTTQWSGGLYPSFFANADQVVFSPEYAFDRDRDKTAMAQDFPRYDLIVPYVWELPVGRGKRFANNANSILNGVIGNWSFSGAFSWRSGLAFTPTWSGVDFSNTGRVGGRPDLVAGCDPYAGAKDVHGLWFNPACFAQPAQGTNGNVQINSLNGPGAYIVLFNPWKEFPLNFIREGTKIQIGANIVNLLNNPAYGLPTATINNVNAGKILATGSARALCCHDSVGQRKFVIDMKFIF